MPKRTSGLSEQTHEETGLTTALHQCLACGVIVIDAGGALRLVSSEAASLLEIPPGPAQSIEILPPPIRDILHQRAHGASAASSQLEFSTPSGKQVSLCVSAFASASSTREPLLVLVLSNTAPLRPIEQSLWQLDRLSSLGTLSASMAHEIRNALVAGKTFIDLLLEKNQDSELAELARRELARIDALANGMLKFSGSTRSSSGPVHLHQILDYSLRLVQPQATTKSIELKRRFGAAADTVQGNECELQQAIINLLLNAVEAIGSGGSILLETDLLPNPETNASLPGRLLLRIQDNGPGIAPADMARIFEPFFTSKPGGTGLGLAITRRIISEHSGEISVESQPGRGSTFSILLPSLNESH
jgi:signal transduction histidine kinase